MSKGRKPSSKDMIIESFVDKNENQKNNNIFQPGFKEISAFMKSNPKAGKKEVNAFMRSQKPSLGQSGATFRQIDIGQQSEESLRKEFHFSDKEINSVKHLIGQKGYDAHVALRDKPVADFDKDVGKRISKEAHNDEFRKAKVRAAGQGIDIDSLSPEKQTLLVDISTQMGDRAYTGKRKRIAKAIKENDNETLKKILPNISSYKRRNRKRADLIKREEETSIIRESSPRLDGVMERGVPEVPKGIVRGPASITEEVELPQDDAHFFSDLPDPIEEVNIVEQLMLRN